MLRACVFQVKFLARNLVSLMFHRTSLKRKVSAFLSVSAVLFFTSQEQMLRLLFSTQPLERPLRRIKGAVYQQQTSPWFARSWIKPPRCGGFPKVSSVLYIGYRTWYVVFIISFSVHSSFFFACALICDTFLLFDFVCLARIGSKTRYILSKVFWP